MKSHAAAAALTGILGNQSHIAVIKGPSRVGGIEIEAI
jgi:hypothetical protein